MSILSNTDPVGTHGAALQGVELILAAAKPEMTDELSKSVCSLESLTEEDRSVVGDQYSSLTSQLADDPKISALLAGKDEHTVQACLEAAALTIMSSGNTERLVNTLSMPSQVPSDTRVVNANAGENLYATEPFSLEGYERSTVQRFMASAVVVNIVSVLGGEFERVWFPTQVLGANEAGVSITVPNPKVYRNTLRGNANGQTDFQKASLIDAYYDSSVLRNDTTTIIPHAIAGNAAYLVDPAQVPNVDRVIAGVTVPTRPIAFGAKVDVIKLSEVAALLKGGTLNQTDALDRTMRIDEVAVRFSYQNTTGGTPAAATITLIVSLAGQQTALFTQTHSGSGHEFQLNTDAVVPLRRGAVRAVEGDANAFFGSLVSAVSGASGNDVFTLGLSLSLSGTANVETANVKVYANSAEIVSVHLADGTSVDPVAARTAAGDLAPLGYTLDARRTNANLRSTDLVLDCSSSKTFLLPAHLNGPTVAMSPPGAPNGTTIDHLARAQRVRDNGQAVDALWSLRNELEAGNTLPYAHPAIGAELMQPTYVSARVDISAIPSMGGANAKQALDDVRGALQASITNVANQLISDSRYLAVLESMGYDINDFEVITVSDEDIFPYLMESGEEKFMGNGRSFRHTQCLNNRMSGKIFLSLRRKTRDGKASFLDFGTHVFKPSIVAKLTATRQGSVSDEIHAIPVSVHYPLLPVLGEITVENLRGYYTV